MSENGMSRQKKEFIKDIFGIVLFPLFIIVICLSLFFVFLSPTVAIIKDGGMINYSDEAFARYRDEQYEKYFGSSSAKEDNVLIIFLTKEDFTKYYCVAKVGDNVSKSISVMYGGQDSTFGKIVKETVPDEDYKFVIDRSLASITNQMATKIQSLDLESSYQKESDRSKLTESQFVNYTSFSISRETVNSALEDFTSYTDIPIVVVVDSAETVFGKVMPGSDILFLSGLICVSAFCIFVIIKKVVRRVKVERNINDIKSNSLSDIDDDDE